MPSKSCRPSLGDPKLRALRVGSKQPLQNEKLTNQADRFRPGKAITPVSKKLSPGIQACEKLFQCVGSSGLCCGGTTSAQMVENRSRLLLSSRDRTRNGPDWSGMVFSRIPPSSTDFGSKGCLEHQARCVVASSHPGKDIQRHFCRDQLRPVLSCNGAVSASSSQASLSASSQVIRIPGAAGRC